MRKARRLHFSQPRAPFLDRPLLGLSLDLLVWPLHELERCHQVLSGREENGFCAKVVVDISRRRDLGNQESTNCICGPQTWGFLQRLSKRPSLSPHYGTPETTGYGLGVRSDFYCFLVKSGTLELPVITGYGSGVVSNVQQMCANNERAPQPQPFETAWLAGSRSPSRFGDATWKARLGEANGTAATGNLRPRAWLWQAQGAPLPASKVFRVLTKHRPTG